MVLFCRVVGKAHSEREKQRLTWLYRNVLIIQQKLCFSYFTVFVFCVFNCSQSTRRNEAAQGLRTTVSFSTIKSRHKHCTNAYLFGAKSWLNVLKLTNNGTALPLLKSRLTLLCVVSTGAELERIKIATSATYGDTLNIFHFLPSHGRMNGEKNNFIIRSETFTSFSLLYPVVPPFKAINNTMMTSNDRVENIFSLLQLEIILFSCALDSCQWELRELHVCSKRTFFHLFFRVRYRATRKWRL